MSILRPEKHKAYNHDTAIDRQIGQESTERRSDRRLILESRRVETYLTAIAQKRRRKRTSGLRHRLGQLQAELQRSPKRGGPRRNSTEIQTEIDRLRTKISEIWPEWEERG